MILEDHLTAHVDIYRHLRNISNEVCEILPLIDWMRKDMLPRTMSIDEVRDYIKDVKSPFDDDTRNILPLWTESPSGNYYRTANNILALLIWMEDNNSTDKWVYGKDWVCWTSKPDNEDGDAA